MELIVHFGNYFEILFARLVALLFGRDGHGKLCHCVHQIVFERRHLRTKLFAHIGDCLELLRAVLAALGSRVNGELCHRAH